VEIMAVNVNAILMPVTMLVGPMVSLPTAALMTLVNVTLDHIHIGCHWVVL